MEYASIEWRQGEPYSTVFSDIYFSAAGGREESGHVFLQQNNLAARFASTHRFIIAETGLGTGLNLALTLKLWDQYAPSDAHLDYVAIENSPLSPDDIRRVAMRWPDLENYFSALLSVYPLPVTGRHMRYVMNNRVRLHFCFMDVADALQDESLGINAWYLDGFAPAKNPGIWNPKVFSLIGNNSAQGATLTTYSAAGFVRRGLEQAGFSVEKCRGYGTKREMITAQWLQPGSEPGMQAPWYRPPKINSCTRHAIVLGAGLAGLAVAWSLIRRGWAITLVDKHADVAAEASGNDVGLVLPRLSVDDSCDVRFYRAAFLHAVAGLDELQAHFEGERVFWKREGVYCALPAERVNDMLHRNNFNASYLHIAKGAGEKARLNADTTVLNLPCAGRASPKQVCHALRNICGDRLQFVNADVSQLKYEKNDRSDRWRLLSASQALIAESENLVLASGVHVAKFEQTAWLPIRSARGQLTELESKQPATRLEQGWSIDHYIAPALDDECRYICGATYRLDDECSELRLSDQNENLDFIRQHFPDRFEMPNSLRGRVGFRTVCDDRMPVAGAVPDAAWFAETYHDLRHGRPLQDYPAAKHLPGLYLSAAHGSRGLTSCFLAAEIIVAQMTQTLFPVERRIVDALNPARFIVRRLKRGG